MTPQGGGRLIGQRKSWPLFLPPFLSLSPSSSSNIPTHLFKLCQKQEVLIRGIGPWEMKFSFPLLRAGFLCGKVQLCETSLRFWSRNQICVDTGTQPEFRAGRVCMPLLCISTVSRSFWLSLSLSVYLLVCLFSILFSCSSQVKGSKGRVCFQGLPIGRREWK